MNILMLTNTYTPHVGGVARSVQAFADEYRARGHRVVIVAPEFDNMPEGELDVVRVPAVQNFNGSDFSVRLPLPGYVSSQLEDFRPDIIHAHHPFLLGDNALRIAALWDVPLVFTHHTMYEQYTHYVPGDSPAMQRFIIDLTSSYANMCDRVFAPSESVAAVIRDRGVFVPVEVVPTGVDVARFAQGDGRVLRAELGIPDEAFVVGHIGRLAPEKNLEFLAGAVARMLKRQRQAHFLVVGSGPSEAAIRQIFAQQKMLDRLHMPGSQSGQALVDAYHAMDLFAFASQSETQGMVLTEAMAAGTPVVAVDASGAREVVVDRKNGRLLPSQDRRSFAAALNWVAELPPNQREQLREQALQTAEQFSMANSAQTALELYEKTIKSDRRAKNPDDSTLESAGRMLTAEWELWASVARAAGSAIQGQHLWKAPILGPILRGYNNFRRRVSRSEWGASLLGLSKSEGTATEPGLILLQIDGFSRTQLERALKRRRMPFLHKLMTREGYHLHTMFPGVPTTTPAVQGELFYGVRQSVPAFSYRDHQTGEATWMLDPEQASRVQSRLGSQGQGLLADGSAYSNIYTGGAKEPHFCASVMGWGDLLERANPGSLFLLGVTNIASVVRTLWLMSLEFVLAVGDGIVGIAQGRNLFRELKFIPSRIAVCILLRDLVTIGVCMDATRGLPIIQANFLGYDEQAHLRGPGSNFAHWTLKGIDRAIRRIWKAAHRSGRRDYQVWIYSDHGQEHSIPYYQLHGREVNEAIALVLQAYRPEADSQAKKPRPQRGVTTQRAQWLGGGKAQKLLPREAQPASGSKNSELIVTALGPLGLVYPVEDYSYEQRIVLAEKLVDQAQIPLVIVGDAEQPGQKSRAITPRGEFSLPEQAHEVLGEDHPFAHQAAEELVSLCNHPDSGCFLISGWRIGEPAVSFVTEYGAHAGPGPEETNAFALLPGDAPVSTDSKHPYIRTQQLRSAVLQTLGRTAPDAQKSHTQKAPSHKPKHQSQVKPKTFKVLTYNVHTCIGMDGKLSPARIARVIAQCDPDVVALQELDVHRPRTGKVHQVAEIARALRMHHHFHPSITMEEELYGDAILSRVPMELVRAASLPTLEGRPIEPRGALWVTITIGDQKIQLINTHLGLSPTERMAQAEALLGPQWLQHPDCQGPVVLCGDFNALPSSQVYKRLTQQLRDAQLHCPGHKPVRTWASRYPIGRVDHVFASNSLKVRSIQVPKSHLCRTASDHLPLLVEFELSEDL